MKAFITYEKSETKENPERGLRYANRTTGSGSTPNPHPTENTDEPSPCRKPSLKKTAGKNPQEILIPPIIFPGTRE